MIPITTDDIRRRCGAFSEIIFLPLSQPASHKNKPVLQLPRSVPSYATGEDFQYEEPIGEGGMFFFE